MPLLGKALGGVNFATLALELGKDPSGASVLLKYGVFLQSIVDFVIIAFVLFIALRAVNNLKNAPPAPAGAPAAPPRQEVLLEEIRDALRAR